MIMECNIMIRTFKIIADGYFDWFMDVRFINSHEAVATGTGERGEVLEYTGYQHGATWSFLGKRTADRFKVGDDFRDMDYFDSLSQQMVKATLFETTIDDEEVNG
jgi:hypothetical protein